MPYKKHLTETIQLLIATRDELFTQALNLKMSGEMAEVNELFEEGEEVTFKLSDLQSSSDSNVQELVKLMTTIEEMAEKMMNLNEIELE